MTLLQRPLAMPVDALQAWFASSAFGDLPNFVRPAGLPDIPQTDAAACTPASAAAASGATVEIHAGAVVTGRPRAGTFSIRVAHLLLAFLDAWDDRIHTDHMAGTLAVTGAGGENRLKLGSENDHRAE